jgi:very-short-patch-repair endonuclease
VWSVDANNSPQLTTPTVDRAVALVAAEQHGVVTRAQLLSAGLSAGDIAYRLRIGRLIAVHRGVYAVGHLPPSPHAKAMAAVLACGPDALLSHRSAGALYGLIRYHGKPDVTAPTKRSHLGINLHRSATAERTVHYGIPTTTPARTLLDLADVLDLGSLTSAVNDARLRNLLSIDQLAETIANAPGRKTTALIYELAQPPTRSAFERAFLAMVDRHRLPRPEVNTIIHGYEVDALWRPQRLVVELDGRRFHEHAFEDDREKDANLLAAGLSTVRITWLRMVTQPAKEAARLRGLLAQREP